MNDTDNNQPLHPLIPAQPLDKPPAMTQPATTAAAQAKPELEISDTEARALLTINNLEVPAHTSMPFSTKMIMALFGLIIFVAVISAALGAFKSKTGTNPMSQPSSATSSQQSSNTAGASTSNQINQDVQSCTDPVKSLAQC